MEGVGQGWGGCREGPVRPSQLRAGAPPALKGHGAIALKLFQLFINVVQPLHAVFEPVVMLHIRHQ